MRVLMISGDKSFTAGHPRYELARRAVEDLVVAYWGKDALIPRIPKGPYDVVTAQDPFLRGHLAAHLAWWFGAKLSLQVHTDLRACSWFVRSWAGFNLRKATSVRVVSAVGEAQVRALGVRAPVFVIPVFVDIEQFRAIERKQHEGKIVLWVGRFEEEKNPLLAIEVLEEVHAQDASVRLIMLGSGSQESVLRERAAGLPVEFPGWSDSRPYLSTADVVLSTSLAESWGASIVEALAAGVSVVSLDVGIAKEAGAVVTGEADLASTLARILQSCERGELKLNLPTREEWMREWRKSLE